MISASSWSPAFRSLTANSDNVFITVHPTHVEGSSPIWSASSPSMSWRDLRRESRATMDESLIIHHASNGIIPFELVCVGERIFVTWFAQILQFPQSHAFSLERLLSSRCNPQPFDISHLPGAQAALQLRLWTVHPWSCYLWVGALLLSFLTSYSKMM